MIGALIAIRNAPKVLEAFNRPDLEIFLSDWVDDATLVYPRVNAGVSGTHTGKIAIHWDTEATNRDGYRIQNSGVNVMTISCGKLIHFHKSNFDTGKKFRAAWVEGNPRE